MKTEINNNHGSSAKPLDTAEQKYLATASFDEKEEMVNKVVSAIEGKAKRLFVANCFEVINNTDYPTKETLQLIDDNEASLFDSVDIVTCVIENLQDYIDVDSDNVWSLDWAEIKDTATYYASLTEEMEEVLLNAQGLHLDYAHSNKYAYWQARDEQVKITAESTDGELLAVVDMLVAKHMANRGITLDRDGLRDGLQEYRELLKDQAEEMLQ